MPEDSRRGPGLANFEQFIYTFARPALLSRAHHAAADGRSAFDARKSENFDRDRQFVSGSCLVCPR